MLGQQQRPIAVHVLLATSAPSVPVQTIKALVQAADTAVPLAQKIFMLVLLVRLGATAIRLPQHRLHAPLDFGVQLSRLQVHNKPARLASSVPPRVALLKMTVLSVPQAHFAKDTA